MFRRPKGYRIYARKRMKRWASQVMRSLQVPAENGSPSDVSFSQGFGRPKLVKNPTNLTRREPSSSSLLPRSVRKARVHSRSSTTHRFVTLRGDAMGEYGITVLDN